ncbi:MAG: hypothetical protein ABI615_12735 [Chthoniobacterales bacterium]
MSNPPPMPRDQYSVDISHLRILGIFHFVGAVFAFLAMALFFSMYAMVPTLLADPEMWARFRQSTAPPQEVVTLLQATYLCLGSWFLGLALMNGLSGLYLCTRKHRVFSIIVACVNLLHVPFGSILAIFTFVVLLRKSVRELYLADK